MDVRFSDACPAAAPRTAVSSPRPRLEGAHRHPEECVGSVGRRDGRWGGILAEAASAPGVGGVWQKIGFVLLFTESSRKKAFGAAWKAAFLHSHLPSSGTHSAQPDVGAAEKASSPREGRLPQRGPASPERPGAPREARLPQRGPAPPERPGSLTAEKLTASSGSLLPISCGVWHRPVSPALGLRGRQDTPWVSPHW